MGGGTTILASDPSYAPGAQVGTSALCVCAPASSVTQFHEDIITARCQCMYIVTIIDESGGCHRELRAGALHVPACLLPQGCRHSTYAGGVGRNGLWPQPGVHGICHVICGAVSESVSR